jgi:hypothetical protein
MRILMMAAFAALTATGASADAKKDDLPPIACIVEKTQWMPQADLLALVKGGFATTTGAEKALMSNLGRLITSCREHNGWNKARQDIAIRYFSAKLLHDDAVAQGGKFALTEAVLQGYVASLDPAVRDSYGKGQVTPEMNRAAFTYLQNAKIALEGRPAEELQAIGQALNSGIYAIILEQDTKKAY